MNGGSLLQLSGSLWLIINDNEGKKRVLELYGFSEFHSLISHLATISIIVFDCLIKCEHDLEQIYE
jgi:hypothetical protein